MTTKEMVYVCFIGCTKTKKTYRCKPTEMYSESTLFKKQLKYIETVYNCDYYILSAKYGLLHPDHDIEPYDLSLYDMNSIDYKNWCSFVYDQMITCFDTDKIKAVFLCGNKYRKPFLNVFDSYEEPFKGLGIGQQMKKINEVIL